MTLDQFEISAQTEIAIMKIAIFCVLLCLFTNETFAQEVLMSLITLIKCSFMFYYF